MDCDSRLADSSTGSAAPVSRSSQVHDAAIPPAADQMVAALCYTPPSVFAPTFRRSPLLNDALQLVSIEVTAELGQIEINASDLLDLAPGTLIDVDIDPTNGIALKIGETTVAWAQLVATEAGIGLQVTRIET
jgi:flagellar motor switch/type III secretory pathway protein FliN